MILVKLTQKQILIDKVFEWKKYWKRIGLQHYRALMDLTTLLEAENPGYTCYIDVEKKIIEFEEYVDDWDFEH